MNEEDLENIQKGYEELILDFLRKHRTDLAKRKNPSFKTIQQKIKAVEEAVSTIFQLEKKEDELAPVEEMPALEQEAAPVLNEEIPSVLYPQNNHSSVPIVVNNLSIGIFLNIEKDKQKLSIPISFFEKKSKEDIAAFLTIYSRNIQVGFGVDYNRIPWNAGSDGNSYLFESQYIGVWFEGVKKILKGDKLVRISYSKGSKACIERLNPKYILLEDTGLAPSVQVPLDDFLPSFLTACIKYLSFLNKMQPTLEQILKQQEKSELYPNIINDLDIPNFKQRVRHLRRNLYSSSFF